MDEDFDTATIEEDNNGWFRSLRGTHTGLIMKWIEMHLKIQQPRKFL